MFQVFIAKRVDDIELLIEKEKHVAGSDNNFAVVERNSSQTAVPSSPGPVDI